MTASLVVTVSQDFDSKVRDRLADFLAEAVEITANSIFQAPPSVIRRIEFAPAAGDSNPRYLVPQANQPPPARKDCTGYLSGRPFLQSVGLPGFPRVGARLARYSLDDQQLPRGARDGGVTEGSPRHR